MFLRSFFCTASLSPYKKIIYFCRWEVEKTDDMEWTIFAEPISNNANR